LAAFFDDAGGVLVDCDQLFEVYAHDEDRLIDACARARRAL
jgi:hypothetical protein